MVAVLVGALGLLTLGGGAVYAVMSGKLAGLLAPPDRAAEEDDLDKDRADDKPAPSADNARADKDEPPDDPIIPGDTETRKVGDITVVDVGRTSSELERALRAQQRAAARADQKLLLMVTGQRCEPCRGVDNSLTDERMQRALDKVRLVRVDSRTFLPELAALQIPLTGIPAFFLLDEDVHPVDGIHGGEWDADIPANIAPVLKPFVRGRYHKRRYNWAPGGVKL